MKQDITETVETDLEKNSAGKPSHPETKPSMAKRITSVCLNIIKKIAYIAIFVGLVKAFAALSTVHGKDIPEDYFVDGYPSILGLMNSEMFMGFVFVVTLGVTVYFLYLLWELHEVAVHKVQKVANQHIQVVFALSLCGLFINKTWWVLALIIAFTRWDLISYKISEIISNGISGSKKTSENSQGDK